MRGSVRKRGKTYSYYFDIVVNGERKKKEKGGFKSGKEAETELNKAIYEYENNGYVEPKKITFLNFAMEWLEEYIKPMRKITTYNRYKELINKYLSNIGAMNINEIEPINIEKLLLKIKKDNKTLSGSTLQSIYTILNTIMNRALRLKIVKDNPCKYVERPQREKFTPDTLSVEEIKKVFTVLDLQNEYDYIFNTALRLTLELGLRRGELSGLEWENIDFENNLVHVRNNLVYTNGYVRIETTKTKESTRDIYISDDMLNLLKELKAKQDKDKKDYGKFYEENKLSDNDGVTRKYNFVFRWKYGKYVHPMFYTNKIKKVLKAAGINKSVRFHDLRHTNATLLLSQGVDFKTIQTRLGHKDINTTLNIYSHVNKQMQKKATEKFESLFSGPENDGGKNSGK